MKLQIDRLARRRFGVWAIAGLFTLSGCTSVFGPYEKRAQAQLLPTMGNTAHGMLTFIERSDGVQVTYNLVGLPPNSDHALQIHDRGDCNAADASSAGGVFAPALQRLNAERAEGDLGNIHADANGVASGFIVAPDVSLDGVRSIMARSALIHREGSDPFAFPARGPGAALACGVIRR